MGKKLPMWIELNSTLITDKKEIRDVFRYHRRMSELQSAENPTDQYRLDRRSLNQYFGIFPKWKEKISAYFQDLEAQGEKIVHVDVCGRASGQSFGVATSYLFSFKTDRFKRILASPSDVYVDGDLFDPADFHRLLDSIRNGGTAPAFVTFMPVAGLHQYTPCKLEDLPNLEAITYAYLGKRLEGIIRILRPGGYILLERPFQFDGSMFECMAGKPQNMFKLSLAMKRLARKMKCRIEIQSEIGGPYFLVHKPVPKA
jgi:hypothetical protein